MAESTTLERKLDALRDALLRLESVIVAYSGGVDSALLLKVAHDTLGDRATGVTAVSASLADEERKEAIELARRIGARHELINSNELSDPRYLANEANRCYFCKQEVYGLLVDYARENRYGAVVDGTNIDDLKDPRPGRRAAKELGVLSPMVDAGLTKEDIREASRRFDLPTADKPAAACLSSRVPFGTPITVSMLRQIGQAERIFHAFGVRQVRVRHYGDTARIEAAPEEFGTILDHRDEVVAGLRNLGYLHVTLDLEGYRMGSLNQELRAHKVQNGR